MIEKIQELNNIFDNYRVGAECIKYNESGSYYFYDILLKPKARIRDIDKYSDEIALLLKSPSKPNITLDHNEGIIRLEFFKAQPSSINIFDMLPKNVPDNSGLRCLLGKTINGEDVWFDLAQAPHLLVAGTTGSGKSTVLHTILANLFAAKNIKLYLMDPKNIEFCHYAENINKDLQVYHDYSSCIGIIDRLCQIMEFRYGLIRKDADVLSSLPYIVVIIDEFSDLILQDDDRKLYSKLCQLVQKCRAAKMHVILSTQRPSVNVINGTIKANFPARISCKTASGIDSKVILDVIGAEKLFGKGDALIKLPDSSMYRFQCAYTNANEICKYFGKLNA